ncbi:response regulator transcription factor [Actinomadura madurae]|uniref:response regulator transcription factor n=1 Tax=Actinomadura madurae TaxID=1993 RepID=UPI000408BC47
MLSPEVSARLAAASAAAPPPVLSARESQVLALVAEGLTNAEIGGRLHIGQATVKTHLLRIFGKLGVSDRTAAVMTALERRILPPP